MILQMSLNLSDGQNPHTTALLFAIAGCGGIPGSTK